MKANGFSFIEVLVSSFILSVAVLGMVAMQSIALKSLVEVKQRALADSLAVDIVERMELNNRWLAESGHSYDITSLAQSSVSKPSCLGTGGVFVNCSGEQIKQNDLFEWKEKLLTAGITDSNETDYGLIKADACIATQSDKSVLIVLTWFANLSSSDGASAFSTGSLQASCGSSGANRRQLFVVSYPSQSI